MQYKLRPCFLRQGCLRVLKEFYSGTLNNSSGKENLNQNIRGAPIFLAMNFHLVLSN